MRRTILILAVLSIFQTNHAQRKSNKPPVQRDISIPMVADRWAFQEGKVEFLKSDNSTSLKILPGAGQVVLKDFEFSDGTIEFDATPTDVNAFFVGIYFRRQDAQEGECFYLRVGKKDSHKQNDAVQYAPVIKNVLLWDLMGHYQAPAKVNNTAPNHIRLVIAGAQMRVYVNDDQKPALEIPRLEGSTTKGSISLEGTAIFSNLVIKPDITNGLSPNEGADLTNHDANYIRGWSVTEPLDLPPGREITGEELPKENAKWSPVSAERRGLVNLTRLYGKTDQRRYIWLKATIVADADQKNKLSLGFSDDVWVIINRRLLYTDKNWYQHPIRKSPAGRISTENTSFALPLKSGDNELLICVTNDFYGWGIIARLESMEGVEFKK
jgi:hypothetical protein